MAKPAKKIILGQAEKKPSRSSQRTISWLWIGGCLLSCLFAFWLGKYLNQPSPTTTGELAVSSQIDTSSTAHLERAGVFVIDTPLVDLLGSLHLSSDDARFFRTELAIYGHDRAMAGNRFSLRYLDQEFNRLESFTFEANDSVLVCLTKVPYLDVEVIERPVEVKEKAHAGIITSTYWAAILDSPDLHHSLIPLSETALRWSVDLFHLRPGDRFKLLYREKTIGGQSVGVEELLAIQIQTQSGIHTAMSYPVAPDSLVYVDPNGYSLQRRFLRSPVKFGIISSPYNPRRLHPVDGVVRGHWGIDYAAPEGTPIYAMADGTITRANYTPANGNNVLIRHDGVYTTGYLHLSEFAPGLKAGDHVRQGQVIGFVGQTGKATGPHVCFRFRENGDEVDFKKYNDTGSPTFIPSETSSFINFSEELMGQLDRVEINDSFF